MILKLNLLSKKTLQFLIIISFKVYYKVNKALKFYLIKLQ
jgi:hypothetical protein